ncbi:MAG: diguanylate cyclase [Pseudorhizobium pelagicum]|uniref:diguanylate cyclase n=1 Tax=Pseudorhizobium pelagicum TaxID=1509405 RepID=UPI00346156E4
MNRLAKWKRGLLIAVACGVLAVNSAVLYASLTSLVETANRVKHSLDVKDELAQVAFEMASAESGQRGYILTANIRYLDPYYRATNRVQGRLDRLRELLVDDEQQFAKVEQIDQLIAQKFAEMAETIDAQSMGSSTEAAELVRRNRGEGIARQFHETIGAMETDEESTLAERQQEADVARQAAFFTLAGFVATIAALLAILYYLTKREMNRKIQASEELEVLAGQLQERQDNLVRERNEVAQLNEASNFLQSCEDMAEISAVMGPFLQKMFPGHAGTIYTTAPSRNRLDLLSAWGEADGDAPQHFAPQQCWGLRRGQVHMHSADDVSPCCEHFCVDSKFEATLCIPLSAHGETLGLLTLVHDDAARQDKDEDIRRRAEMVARQVGLTLSNIRLRESLRDQSIRDPMTKAYNRRHLEAVVEKEFARAERFKRPLSIAMLDIDHFKRYNDTHGHQAGDAALIAVSQHIQSSLRATDWLFRYGGEEFLILLSEADAADASTRLDAMRASISELGVMIDGVPLPHVTVSCGVAVLIAHGETFDELVAAADEALYEAKKSGRNQVKLAADTAPKMTLIA